MSYLKTYHVAIPRFKIAGDILHPAGRKTNHSLAYVDEDIITLAYSACCDLNEEVDAVLFASRTPLFTDRYHASYLANLLGLPEGLTALDLGSTNRAGTDALLMADTLIRSGKHKNVLLVAADIRYPPIGQELKIPFGHAAVAMLISKDKGIAEIEKIDSYSAALSEEFIYKSDKVQYDPRFARNVGFKNNMKLALPGLDPKNIDSLIINSAYAKLISGTLKRSGFNMNDQVLADTLVPKIGYTGSVHALLRLVHTIENRKGSCVLVDYNNGSNVIHVNIEETVNPIFDSLLNDTIAVKNYQDYLIFRKQARFEGKAYQSIEMFSSEMLQEREKENLLYLKANKCSKCGTIYYLEAARCNACHHSDFSQVQLEKTGTVYSCTSEYYFPASFPPTNMLVIDLDGGGRITVQQTDDMVTDPVNAIQIGDKVQLVLRKMMEKDKKPNYFWKCVKQ